jgi:hypothetical protein
MLYKPLSFHKNNAYQLIFVVVFSVLWQRAQRCTRWSILARRKMEALKLCRHPGSSIATKRSGKACATAPLPFWKNVKLFKKAVMKRFAADTEDWVLHEVSPVARAGK